MAEYIKREDVRSRLDNLVSQHLQSRLVYDRTVCVGINEAFREVQCIPAADVRLVVLCCDCKYFHKDSGKCLNIDGMAKQLDLTDFCSCGAKMDADAKEATSNG